MTSFEFGTNKPEGLFDDWDERSYPWLPADDAYQERFRRGRAALAQGVSPEQIQQILADPRPEPPCTKPCCARPQQGGLW
jgi:hypothetical protein